MRKQLPGKRNQKPQWYAPGRIYAPIIEDRTGFHIAILTFIIIGFIILLLCIFLITPGNTPASGIVFIMLMLSPFAGAISIALIKVYAAATKQTPQEILEEGQAQVLREEHELAARAARAALYAPVWFNSGDTRLGILGAPSIGTLAWCFGEYAILPEAELAKHIIVVGGSGSGKTTTLLRIALIASLVYGYRVFYLDAKGDRATAAAFMAMMQQAGNAPRMFPREPLDGWRGDGNAQLNRLIAVESFTEPYYKAVTKRVLALICNNPAGPPRNSKQFFSQFNSNLAKVSKLPERDLSGVELRYRAFFDALVGKLDAGWSWEDCQSAYLLLDGLALREEAASLGRYLLEDFAHYAISRKKPGKDLLIVDEFSALSTTDTDTANLVERLRSFDCSIILSVQSYAALGPREKAERILDAAGALILHRCAAPDELAARAGKEQQMQQLLQFGGMINQQIMSSGSAQYQEESHLHPDYVRRLAIGESVTIAHGRFLKAHISPVPVQDPAIIQQVRVWIEQLTPASPTAQPPPILPP